MIAPRLGREGGKVGEGREGASQKGKESNRYQVAPVAAFGRKGEGARVRGLLRTEHGSLLPMLDWTGLDWTGSGQHKEIKKEKN